MRIERVDTSYYRLPLPLVGDAGHGRIETEELVLVRLRAGGVEATGYAYTIGRGGRAIQAMVEHDLKPLLLETSIAPDVESVEAVWRRLWRSVLYVGRGGLAAFAVAAVDIALWDWLGKVEGRPLYRLLGGASRPIPVYGSGVDLPLSLDDLLRQVETWLAKGYRAVKIKVGRPDPREDLERVSAVRRRIGDGVDLMVDANMGWTLEEALDRGRALEPFRLFWLEEPTIPEDVEGHARLARELDARIAVGESLHSVHEFARYVRAGAVEVVQVDPVTVGGITPWREVQALAAQHGLPMSSHYADEISAHLLAASHQPLYLEKHAFALDPYLIEPQRVEDGHVRPTETPGHGLRFDLDRLEPYRG